MRLRPVWQLSRGTCSARSRSPIIHPMQTKNLLILGLGLLVAIGQATPYASAGEATVLGGYAISAHWRDDPARVQQGNAIILEFAVVDQSAAHLKPTDFDFVVIEDGARTVLAITVDENGVISAPFTPTKAGRASVVVSGSIDGIDESVALTLTDISPQMIALPAIGVEALGTPEGTDQPGLDWVMIAGIGLAALLMGAAVLLGRNRP